MKLTPTVALALALTAGMAGAAIAQTTAAPAAAQPAAPATAQPSAPYSQTQPTYAQPGSNPQANTGGAMRSSAATAQNAAGDQVRQAQAQLQAAGLYKGPVDGQMDPDTRMAIGRFQEQHGLRRTENLDQPTLAQLISSQATGYGSSAPAASSTVTGGTPGSVPAPTGAGGNATGQSSQH